MSNRCDKRTINACRVSLRTINARFRYPTAPPAQLSGSLGGCEPQRRRTATPPAGVNSRKESPSPEGRSDAFDGSCCRPPAEKTAFEQRYDEVEQQSEGGQDQDAGKDGVDVESAFGL